MVKVLLSNSLCVTVLSANGISKMAERICHTSHVKLRDVSRGVHKHLKVNLGTLTNIGFSMSNLMNIHGGK